MNRKNHNLIYLLLTALTVIGGYAFLRYAYRISDRLPFTQEIILIVLGTVATVLITALLLNKQTEVELQKEQRVRFLELKSQVYMDLIRHIETVLLDRSASREDAIKLQFLGHRLSIVASPAVLVEFERFLQTYNDALSDRIFNPGDSARISRALAELTIAIRRDLVGELDENTGQSQAFIKHQVLDNADEAIKGTRSG